jgi:histidyl-tRNA synthetase
MNEVELISIVERVFGLLGINVVLKLNNRKVLYGIAEVMGHADKMIDITVAIDKLEKIGLENVKAELAERGIEAEAVAKLEPILMLSGSTAEKLEQLRWLENGYKIGVGISDVETVGIDTPEDLARAEEFLANKH